MGIFLTDFVKQCAVEVSQSDPNVITLEGQKRFGESIFGIRMKPKCSKHGTQLGSKYRHTKIRIIQKNLSSFCSSVRRYL